MVGAGRTSVVAPGRPWGWLVPAHETTPVLQVPRHLPATSATCLPHGTLLGSLALISLGR